MLACTPGCRQRGLFGGAIGAIVDMLEHSCPPLALHAGANSPTRAQAEKITRRSVEQVGFCFDMFDLKGM